MRTSALAVAAMIYLVHIKSKIVTTPPGCGRAIWGAPIAYMVSGWMSWLVFVFLWLSPIALLVAHLTFQAAFSLFVAIYGTTLLWLSARNALRRDVDRAADHLPGGARRP